MFIAGEQFEGRTKSSGINWKVVNPGLVNINNDHTSNITTNITTKVKHFCFYKYQLHVLKTCLA